MNGFAKPSGNEIIIDNGGFVMEFELIKQWLVQLAGKYNVNPIIFGSIYLGAIPFFTASVAWLIRNIRKKKTIILPAFCTGLTFTSAYIYLIIVGRDVPFWVYIIIGIMILYGIYTTYRKIKKQLTDQEGM
ncbi:MAG TPA: hypothetical protein VJ991_03210 [Balneolales bacterium]|nr:hypothetical protein [Balneolales bacterium]